MRLTLRQAGRAGLAEGRLVRGYLVAGVARSVGGEIHYDARSRDGEEVTIVAPAWPSGTHDDGIRFRRLARLRARIHHPALLAVHAWDERRGTPYLVTDPHPSETLAQTLRGDRVPPDVALERLGRVAEALDLCHGQGLVHQNLTADSVLFDDTGAVILDTFGIAEVASDRSWENRDPREFRYGTPEAIRGDEPEPASNIYSLTGLLAHMLTGREPHREVPLPPSNTAWAAALVHLTEPPPRPSRIVPGLGGRIDEVVAWGMAKEPGDRPPSATALVNAAAEALGFAPTRPAAGVPGAAPASTRRGARVRQRARRAAARVSRPAAITIAAGAGCVAGLLSQPLGDGSPRAASDAPEALVLATLDERRTALRSELADASLPQEQSAAASRLAAAHFAVAARGPARLSDAARDTGRAYSDLASAAEAGDEDAFTSASSALTAAEDRLAAQLR